MWWEPHSRRRAAEPETGVRRGRVRGFAWATVLSVVVVCAVVFVAAEQARERLAAEREARRAAPAQVMPPWVAAQLGVEPEPPLSAFRAEDWALREAEDPQSRCLRMRADRLVAEAERLVVEGDPSAALDELVTAAGALDRLRIRLAAGGDRLALVAQLDDDLARIRERLAALERLAGTAPPGVPPPLPSPQGRE